MTTHADDPRILLDFVSGDDLSLFSAVGDAVMGGVSTGRLARGAAGTAVFEGEVSLDRGGGFASVRSRQREWDIRGATAFLLRVRGDGKRYRFNVRTPGGPAAFRYEAAFEAPAGRWTEVRIPLASLSGKVFGRPVPQARPPDPGRIQCLGFMISDRQAGPFRLEIDWIGVAGAGPRSGNR
jgi:NADH dehydrogenase [ubiquinone] 1 alpha subcomplex assembly factor 1